MATHYVGAVQLLICSLYFKKMVVGEDANEFPLRNDATLDPTT